MTGARLEYAGNVLGRLSAHQLFWPVVTLAVLLGISAIVIDVGHLFGQ